MAAGADLTIAESVLLLALQDETGERRGHYVDIVLAGAGLAGLALRGEIAPDEEKKKHFKWAGPPATDDPYLSHCRAILESKGLRRDAGALIQAISNEKNFAKPLYDGLIARGVLRREEKKVLFFFTRNVYPEVDPNAELALKARLETVLFSHGDVSEKDSLIIALAKHAGLLENNFDKQRLKLAKPRIKKIVEGEALAASATAQAIQRLQAAIMVAVIVPAVVAS